MQRRKCCFHCPGSWASCQKQKEHICNLPVYVKGNLKIESLKNTIGSGRDCEKHRGAGGFDGKSSEESKDRPSSCAKRFAIAKKFHAENLQHQPLPDRVDDSLFIIKRPLKYSKLSKSTNDLQNPFSEYQYGAGRRKKMTRSNGDAEYGPVLGCKKPVTNMDLAICWEAPINPCYEPTWPTHIDGSDGGPAPAIFTLVQREDENGHQKSPVKRFENKFCNIKNKCHVEHHECDRNDSTKDEKGVDLCEGLNAVHISEDFEPENRKLKPGFSCEEKKVPVHLRHCADSCSCRGDRENRIRRTLNSAPVYQGNKYAKRNGLPTKLTVPRPRTPYARRSYCIDTLAPPFSVVEKSRDGDYPEHWRLTSVYQQSYRNPKKLRNIF